jgi:hypothetical protein
MFGGEIAKRSPDGKARISGNRSHAHPRLPTQAVNDKGRLLQ